MAKKVNTEETNEAERITDADKQEGLKNCYDITFFFEVEDSNPNGNPDAENAPREYPETGIGYVTDACIKRKIRNYVNILKEGTPGYNIYVREKAVLNRLQGLAYEYLNEDPKDKKVCKDQDKLKELSSFMCRNYYDIRAFGAMMNTEVNCGIVIGPVSVRFSKSIDPISPQRVTITRMAVTNEADIDKERTMGAKWVIPYALYRCDITVDARLAQRTGFSETDLQLLVDAIQNMFEYDRSSARAQIAVRKVVMFKHQSDLRNAPKHVLMDMIKVQKNTEVPQKFSDYTFTEDYSELSSGVEVQNSL